MPAYRVISADSHVAEPGDLWLRYTPESFHARAPRLVSLETHDVWTGEGMPPLNAGMIAPAGRRSEELTSLGRYADGRAGGWDPHARLKDMQLDGVDAEVLYPTAAIRLFRHDDVAYQDRCFRAYNRWLADYCSAYPDRLRGLALVTVQDLALGIDQMREGKALGLAGAIIAISPDEDKPYSDPRYDPLWSAAEELDMPLSLHIQAGRRDPLRENWLVNYATTPYWVQRSIAQLIFGGVFERHPRLQIISAESDIGWIPNFLERMDHAYRRHRFHTGGLGYRADVLPSEFFRRHVKATFINDRAGLLVRELAGVENLMWSSDYPHSDSTWPHSQEAIATQFAGILETDRQQIVAGNAARLYHFD